MLAQSIPENIKFIVLHSAFIATERINGEQRLQECIGKNARRPDKMIVVGTQVLEQSLDIDFDVLYTDIAPIDLLLQRAGRLHRHNIKRPQHLKGPEMIVMMGPQPNSYGEANEFVYEKYILMKTNHFLPTSIQIPSDISKLVQQVYEEDTDDEIEGIQEAKDKFNLDVKKKSSKAKIFQIEEPSCKPQSTIYGWLTKDRKAADKSDEQAIAAVRDIQETLEVVLLERTEHGICLMDGQNIKEVSDKVIAQQVIRIPNVVTIGKIEKSINELENETHAYYPDWEQSQWLKGSLALTMDENATAMLNDYKLRYSSKFGLIHEKVIQSDR